MTEWCSCSIGCRFRSTGDDGLCEWCRTDHSNDRSYLLMASVAGVSGLVRQGDVLALAAATPKNTSVAEGDAE